MAMEREPQITVRNIPESQASSYNIGGQAPGGGGLGGWISQHKVMAAVIGAALGGLVIWFFYNKANDQPSAQTDTGQTQDVTSTGAQPQGDTTGTAGGSPDTLYDMPGVLSALSGIEQTQQQILSEEQGEDAQPGGPPQKGGNPPVKKKCHSHKHTHHNANGKKTTHTHRHCIPPTHHSSAEPSGSKFQEVDFNEPTKTAGTGGGPMHVGRDTGGTVFGGYLRQTPLYHTSLHMKEPHPRSGDSRSIYHFPL